MSGEDPVGSGYSERAYDIRKKARDNLERDLVKCGTKPAEAKRIADRTANETENRRRGERKAGG